MLTTQKLCWIIELKIIIWWNICGNLCFCCMDIIFSQNLHIFLHFCISLCYSAYFLLGFQQICNINAKKHHVNYCFNLHFNFKDTKVAIGITHYLIWLRTRGRSGGLSNLFYTYLYGVDCERSYLLV